MASWVTVSQWPMGTLSSTVSDAQALHTLPRVQLVWSRARSTRRSSSPCLVRSRATLAADTKENVVRQRRHVGCILSPGALLSSSGASKPRATRCLMAHASIVSFTQQLEFLYHSPGALLSSSGASKPRAMR